MSYNNNIVNKKESSKRNKDSKIKNTYQYALCVDFNYIISIGLFLITPNLFLSLKYELSL